MMSSTHKPNLNSDVKFVPFKSVSYHIFPQCRATIEKQDHPHTVQIYLQTFIVNMTNRERPLLRKMSSSL